jgi:acyl phosphate:glycerol-3-phosphate acyltransferase
MWSKEMMFTGIQVEFFQNYPWAAMGFAYFLGSLPFAVVIGNLAGVDPRKKGSGNPGASNVTRVMGLKWGVLTLLLDAGKSALACLLALPLGLGWACIASFLAVFAHCTSPFLGFKGGRGVASTLGCLLILHPGLMSICLFIWVCILMTTRKPAWASIIMAFVLILASNLQGVADEIRTFAIAASTVIIARHWVYIQRLLGQRTKSRSAKNLKPYVAKKVKKRNKNKKRSF